MKRIVFLANDYFSLYNYRKELMKQLVDDGNEVFALITDDTHNYKIENLGVKVITVPMDRRGNNPIKDAKVIKNYKKIISYLKPDIMIAYTIKASIYGGMVARFLKVPFISTITGVGSAFHKNAFLKALVIAMYKVAFRKAKCIFFQNDVNRDTFIEKKIIKPEQVVRVSGSGVDLNKFYLADYPNNEKFNILFIGRIMKEKGMDELLNVVEKMNNKNIEFILLGEMIEEDYLPRLNALQSKGLLRYDGLVDNVDDYIRACNLIVLPSYHEGLNNAILEGGASGRPVVATNINGCIESIDENETGFLCDKESTDSLYAVLDKAINTPIDELAEMGRKARAKMEKEFDRQSVKQVYLDKIYEIVGKD